MDYSNLNSEEQEIVKRFRMLKEAQKKAVVASQSSFIEWLKNAVSWVWEKVSGYAKEIWNFFRDMFA